MLSHGAKALSCRLFALQGGQVMGMATGRQQSMKIKEEEQPGQLDVVQGAFGVLCEDIMVMKKAEQNPALNINHQLQI